jgi:hypothetical protein
MYASKKEKVKSFKKTAAPPHWSSLTAPEKRRPMKERLTTLLICLRTTLDQCTSSRKRSFKVLKKQQHL